MKYIVLFKNARKKEVINASSITDAFVIAYMAYGDNVYDIVQLKNYRLIFGKGGYQDERVHKA